MAGVLIAFVPMLLGTVWVFAVNPRNTSVGLRLLVLGAVSIATAPVVLFIAVAADAEVSARTVIDAYLLGPLMLLWLSGLGAIGDSCRWLVRSAWRLWRERSRPAS